MGGKSAAPSRSRSGCQPRALRQASGHILDQAAAGDMGNPRAGPLGARQSVERQELMGPKQLTRSEAAAELRELVLESLP